MTKKDFRDNNLNENFETLTPDMFASEKAEARSSNIYLYKTLNKKIDKKFNFSMSLEMALHKEDAKNNAILILRSLMNIYSRGFPNAKCESFFEKNLLRETYLKSGKLEAEILARDALLEKFFT